MNINELIAERNSLKELIQRMRHMIEWPGDSSREEKLDIVEEAKEKANNG